MKIQLTSTLGDTSKSVLRGKFVTIITYIKKKENIFRSKLENLEVDKFLDSYDVPN
jgi:hypothetical protein